MANNTPAGRLSGLSEDEFVAAGLTPGEPAVDDRHYEVGISFFLADGPRLRDTLPMIWTSEIEPYLEEYFYDEPSKVEEFRWSKLANSKLADWA